MMSDMFLSPERPLYQGAQVINIKEIDEPVYYGFSNDWFQKRGQQLPQDVFHYLYDMVDGQTWYVQATLNRIYSNHQSGSSYIGYSQRGACPVAYVSDVYQ